MFNEDFYPTPPEVIDMMNFDCFDKVVLEPSAGKGNIVNYLKSHGAKEVIACETHPELQKILQGSARILKPDFLKVSAQEVSHINMIVMNPPFTFAERHIQHAWNIAPEGCEIISLCNWETLDNPYSRSRSEVSILVENYGEKQNLGNCFKYAERKTNVEIGLVRLFKPAVSTEFDYDGFYLNDEPEAQDNAVISYNEVRAIVNSYVAAVKCFDKVLEVQSELNRYTSITEFGSGLSFKAGYENQVTNKLDFAKQMQKHCWKHIFKKMAIEKYVTNGVMQDINKFVESRQNYPFTMRNVYRMFEIIIGTRDNIMNRAIVEAVDNFTKYTHENRYGVEGWKTNEGHLLNKKFISGWISEPNYSRGLGIKDYQRSFGYILDLVKALCYLTGTDFDRLEKIQLSSCRKYNAGNYLDKNGNPISGTRDYDAEGYNKFEPNKWYSWGFFDFKVFKKGTGHFKFKDENVWATLNRAYAKAKGQVLPEKL